LHGTSITTVPQLLEKAGYSNLNLVSSQSEPDPEFPTVKSPNPEEPEALELAIKLANEKQSDLAIGTDPDGDRLGIAVRNRKGELALLNGNQTMVLMTWYLLEKMKESHSLKEVSLYCLHNSIYTLNESIDRSVWCKVYGKPNRL